jgi:hypothetical protein
MWKCHNSNNEEELQILVVSLTLKISGGEEIPAVSWHFQTRPVNLDVRHHCLSSELGVALVCKHIGRQYPCAS